MLAVATGKAQTITREEGILCDEDPRNSYRYAAFNWLDD